MSEQEVGNVPVTYWESKVSHKSFLAMFLIVQMKKRQSEGHFRWLTSESYNTTILQQLTRFTVWRWLLSSCLILFFIRMQLRVLQSRLHFTTLQTKLLVSTWLWKACFSWWTEFLVLCCRGLRASGELRECRGPRELAEIRAGLENRVCLVHG